MLRLYATRTILPLRSRVIVALLHLLIGLGERGETFARRPELAVALDALSLLRGTVSPSVADLAAQARFMLFERPRRAAGRRACRARTGTLQHTWWRRPDPAALERAAAAVGLSAEDARRIELWRLAKFELERLDVSGFAGIHAFYGVSRDDNRDERIICFAEVGDVGPGVPYAPDLALFEERFHEAIEAMRRVQGERDPDHRLQWNRLYLFVRPPIALSNQLLTEALRRLAPETGHLGLEKVIVRLASFERDAPDAPRKIELLAGNPSGSRVEWSLRVPHDRPLDPATPYAQRVATARARGLIYPYEIVRLFTAPPERGAVGIFHPTGAGSFREYDLVDGAAVAVDREPGQNRTGVVFGVISTPTAKHPEGMRRVLILGDSTRDMGALAAGECDRIVAALDLAERERLPVEWVALSGGARIAMDSGTENLDATARVVRRLVTFTDAGGEVNVITSGPNVGAQSYFDALASMELRSRGILIMLQNAYMVLTGRAVLEFSGAVAAEDEIGIGGYERIMGPNGEAQYQARDLADAYAILLEHYGCSYVAPGEKTPRRFATSDSAERDAMLAAYEGDEGFKTLGEVFSAEANPDRKRPVRDAAADARAGRRRRRLARALARLVGRRDRDRLGLTPGRRAGHADRDREPPDRARRLRAERRPRQLDRGDALPAVVEEGRARAERGERQPPGGDPRQPVRLRRLARVDAPRHPRVRRRDRARDRALRRPDRVHRADPLPRRRLRGVLARAQPAHARDRARGQLRVGARRPRRRRGRVLARRAQARAGRPARRGGARRGRGVGRPGRARRAPRAARRAARERHAREAGRDRGRVRRHPLRRARARGRLDRGDRQPGPAARLADPLARSD